MARCLALRLAALLVVLSMPAVGQETFTRQAVMVPMFLGRDRKLADAVGDAVRSRVQRGLRRGDATVVGEFTAEKILERASIERTTTDTFHLRTLAREVRADEVVHGTAERLASGQVRVAAHIWLVRDPRMQQPLPLVLAPTPDSAGALVGAHAVRLRAQMTPLRRCENALREGRPEQAVREGERALATLPEGLLLRTCTMRAMLAVGARAGEVLEHARAILAVHERSWWAIDAAARAHDALGQREQAAAMWVRLAESDTSDVMLGRRVVTALLEGRNPGPAVGLAARLVRQAPDDTELLRMQWTALAATSNWRDAVTIGGRLYAEDPISRADSAFVLRLALARRAAGDTLLALSLAAEGVARFPRDARLYVLYADLVRADSRVAVARGVARFPEVAELRLLRAQELRTTGRVDAAIVELQQATALDTASGQGHLALAQAQAELGMLDSALVEAHRALATGIDTGTVAQFALARGNALYRAANATKQRADYHHALDFLALADSLVSSPQSQFLLGATALSISQQAAAEAPEARACHLSRLASQLLPLAREKITSGAQMAPDAARQYLGYLDELEPVVHRQVDVLCSSDGPSPLTMRWRS